MSTHNLQPAPHCIGLFKVEANKLSGIKQQLFIHKQQPVWQYEHIQRTASQQHPGSKRVDIIIVLLIKLTAVLF